MRGDRNEVGSSTRDVRGLQDQLGRQNQRMRQAEEGDVVIDGIRELKIRSADGTYWGIRVDNAGALSTVDLGDSL